MILRRLKRGIPRTGPWGERLFASERAAGSSSGHGDAGGDDFFDGIAGLLEGVDGGVNANLFAFEVLNEVGADWSQDLLGLSGRAAPFGSSLC